MQLVTVVHTHTHARTHARTHTHTHTHTHTRTIIKNLPDNIETTSRSSFTLTRINEETMYLYPTNSSKGIKIIYNLKQKSGGMGGMS